ncbi:2'-5' RNA ligase family protein [Pseudothauera rhizosphaerae]|nr:2'-5' RNA ligase family protein [Pseudothauera rhizosphaerae]
MSTHPDLPPGSRCVRNVRRDFAEWHRGRPRYALWALDVDVPALQQRMHAAQAHLDGLLLDGYRRQPHVTLSLCGFPSAEPRHADDFGAAALEAQLAALRAARPAPFEIGIGALDSFASAPYLTVNDTDGRIAALRACLAAGDLNRPDGRYTPHVTVGLYADAWPAEAVRPRLASFAPGAALRLRVGGIGLFGYAAADIGGPLARIADYDFASGMLRWHDALPFSC